MISKEYNILRHKVNYTVTESSDEFNKLDPSRKDAANDEAVQNIVYRSMNPEVRATFLHGREEVKADPTANPPIEGVSALIGVEEQMEDLLDGVDFVDNDNLSRKTKVAVGKDGKPRMRDGVEVESYDEAEEAYYNRALALLVKYKKFTSEETARAHFQPLIESIASGVKFDPTAKERTATGPKRLPAKYKLAAAKSITLGTIHRVNEHQLTKIGKSFTPTSTDLIKPEDKVYSGTIPASKDAHGKDIAEVQYNVLDKDAETYGWLIKEYFDWKNANEVAAL
jgi:hypothetical protein